MIGLSFCGKHARSRAAVALGATLASTALVASGAFAASGSGGIGTGEEDSTTVSDGVFPVRGKHSYGDGLGAGRGHQGQDLLAKCGKPVVAAQSGRVQHIDYQASGAGNYVVIDGKGKRPDTVYMHLAQRAKVRKSQRVQAGDLLGRVGSTGRSSACHLHFEMWGGAGWYEGGDPMNPKPPLKRWDRTS